MPHLSPLNWLLSPVTFWLLLALFSSSLWWSQSIFFPNLSSTISTPTSQIWNW